MSGDTHPMDPERHYLSIISGRARGVVPGTARAGLRAVEPLYRSIIRCRNALFDRRIKRAHRLGRPTISVGNITTGGTGKTPVVQWLARRLIAEGGRPAILLRGYRTRAGVSDEAELLRETGAIVQTDPDRVAGATDVLAREPGVTHFILDDGFQHRRAARDFDLVLIDATNPFGHEHVLPRGLLREPPGSLARADAILITRADLVDDIAPTLARLRQHAPAAPVFRASHAIGEFVDAAGQTVQPQRCAAVTGIGNPQAFFDSLTRMRIDLVETHTLADHHAYTPRDLEHLHTLATRCGTIVVTEKDWVKLRRVPGAEALPIARAQLRIDFADGDADALWQLILSAVSR